MRTVIINECNSELNKSDILLDLSEQDPSECSGCWTCWWTTPGRCVFKDLDEFYRGYINSDKAIFFAKVSQGFVSGKLKTLFDRMIPLFMPYTSVSSGESMHLTRYDRYPDIEFYYDGKFISEEGRKVYEDYVYRVFYQFHSRNIVIKPISEYVKKEDVM
ncbi:MAG: hypothetical protein ACRDA3_07875 [Peptostreptococcaceae bacterium]